MKIKSLLIALLSFDLDLTSIGTNESNAYNSLEAFKMNCIVGLDKVADKRLSVIDKILDRLDRKDKNINNEQFLKINTLKGSAQDRIFKAYDECKKSLAAKLRAINLIEQDTADQFDADISAFGLGDNG